MKSKRVRTEPNKEEIKIRHDAISSQIRKEFLKNDLCYVDTKELPFLIEKVRMTDKTRVDLRQCLLQEFGASSVPVGSGKTAIVRRPT